MNPLLDFSGLPRYDVIEPAHVAPAINELIAENRRLVDILTGPQTPSTHLGHDAPPYARNEGFAGRIGRQKGQRRRAQSATSAL